MTFGMGRHRYLYSTGDDRQLLCHDVEVNRVISRFVTPLSLTLFTIYFGAINFGVKKFGEINFGEISSNIHSNQAIENFRCEKFSVGHSSTEIMSH